MMTEGDSSVLWRRAKAIADVSAALVSSGDGLTASFEVKSALRSHNDALHVQAVIKDQLLELAKDRKEYIQVLDRIMDLCHENHDENPEFWGSIEAIILEESAHFQLRPHD
jgi:hypothetical protein